MRNVCVSEMFGSLLVPDQVEAISQALLIGYGGALENFSCFQFVIGLKRLS